MNRSLLALLTSATLASCAPATEPVDLAPDPDPLGAHQTEILGGTVDNGDPEVFLLMIEYSNGTGSGCTATLIGTRTLLTAAHCIDPRMGNATSANIWATNKTYSNAITQAELIPIVEEHYHPSWNPSVSLSHDIAVARLQYAPNVGVKRWNTTSVGTFGGKPLRAVGYGTSSAGGSGSGTKRTVDLSFRQINQSHFTLGDQVGKGICHGDSGGPSFHTFSDGVERQVGVHSYTNGDACLDGADIRVDAYATFINGYLTQWEGPSCEKDGQCKQGCASPDVDCLCKADGVCNAQCPNLLDDADCPKDCVQNGVCSTLGCPTPDLDCVAEGQPCTLETQCQSRRCVSDAQHPAFYCSRPCSQSAECPAGMACPPAGGSCLYLQLTPAAPGMPCTAGQTFCTQGSVCSGPLGGQSSCSRGCVLSSECPSGTTCETGQNNFKFCAEPTRPAVVLARARVEGSAPAGCSSVGGAGSGALLWAAAAAALALRRKATRAVQG